MKKTYKKPEIRKVKLVPSEAVLQSCKTTGAAGPGQQSGCFITLICSIIGS
ncbi:MAG TPA: hypothetical protein P5567_08150 [Kiritimatiellia bacterium]|nr:hypothetical protein [Kiritimatiellia bacterium]HRZ12412.1 hypothetical protein [Kiritimatiellia bacterium]HSA17830.1 hypothetical protein [Kiritimatiellia bacterium]